MELNEIKKQGKWTDISDTLNENFAKVNAETQRLELASRKNKGYYATYDELASIVPQGSMGDIAFVGSNYPYHIYKWNGTEWIDTFETGGAQNVNLADYYTRTDVDNLIKLEEQEREQAYQELDKTLTSRLDVEGTGLMTVDEMINFNPIANGGSSYLAGYLDKPSRYVVTKEVGGVPVNVGILEILSDSSQHIYTQVFTTHFVLDNSGNLNLGSHSDTKLVTYFRSYSIDSPLIDSGTWTKWKDISHYSDIQESIARNKRDIEFLNANTGISEYHLFDEAKAYAVGDIVLYEGLMYRFTSAHAAGAWDGSQVESWNTLKDEKQAFLFTHPQLNKIFKEIFAPIDDYTKVNSVSVNKAVLVEGKWYNAVYVRGNDMPTYTVLSIYFDTQEEALAYANTTHLVIRSDNKIGVVLNMTLVPIGYNNYETKAIHPFTLPFAPYIASHIAIREEATAREAADTALGTRLDIKTENSILSDSRIIKSIFEKEINLFDKYQIGIGYWNIYGLEINNQYIHTKPILFEKNRTYKWPYNKSGLGDNTGIAYVDANNTGIKYLRAEISEDGNYLLFTPESSGYYSINIGYVGTEDTFMVCLADEYPEEYVSHKSKIEKALFPIISRENTDWWVNRTSVNLFNKNNIFEGYWHSKGLQEEATYFHTEPIYLTAGNTYKYLKLGSLGSNLYLAQVTADNTWVNGHAPNVSEDGNYLLFTPESSGYYSFNVGTEYNLEYFMLCRVDEYPDTYEPYWCKWIIPDMFVEKSMLPNNISYNKLFGKKVTFDGDSICYGAGFIGGYGKIIAERNNMVYTNRGVGGGTITAELYSQSGAARHWISRDIPNIDPTSDYVILEGGVNDASLNPALGEITKDFKSELDDTTFCGAFESMIKQCYDLFPNAKLGFIIVHQMTTRFNPRGEFYEKAIAILNKWGVPYLNLAIQAPPMNYIASLKEIYTANADGWHPNELGYKTFYCDKIEEWMRTL